MVPRMRPPIIHPGYHKTGTTFLQKELFQEPSRGFCQPWTVQSGQAIEHFVLAHPRRFDPRWVRQQFEQAVRETGGDNAVPVISHEDLSGNPWQGRYDAFTTLHRLHRTFPEARWLIGIRHQKAMLRSFFGQYIKQDGDRPIAKLLETGRERPGFRPLFRLDHLEYHLLVEELIERSGPEKVLVLPHEGLNRDPAHWLRRVQAFAGLMPDWERGDTPRRHNVGFGAATLSLKRRLNRVGKKPLVPGRDHKELPFTHRGRNKLCRGLDRCLPRAVHATDEARLRRFIEETVGDYYTASNARLVHLTGLDLASLGYEGPPEPAGRETSLQPAAV